MTSNWYILLGTILLVYFPIANGLWPKFNNPVTTSKALFSPMHGYQVKLTQRNYIQFLRYMVDVPEIKEFTYCTWFKTVSTQNEQPIVSYSRGEHQRILKTWIGKQGTSINMAITDKVVQSIKIKFEEHVWYHICQSWDSLTGYTSLYVNGQLIDEKYKNSEFIGLRIPEGGIFVVGQDYTDFDKGLEDGIEGAIFGFNFILTSTLPKSNFISKRHSSTNHEESGNDLIQFASLRPRIPQHSFKIRPKFQFSPLLNYNQPKQVKREERPTKYISRSPKSLLGIETETSTSSILSEFVANFTKSLSRKRRNIVNYLHLHDSNVAQNDDVDVIIPVGLQLIELSYKFCLKARGSPLAGTAVLINWALTPVRMFGGAIVSPVNPVCGNF